MNEQYLVHLPQAQASLLCVAPIIALSRATAAAARSAMSQSCWESVIEQNVWASARGSDGVKLR